LQKIVGIETQSEKAERERLAKLFQIDKNDPNQRAGISLGELMVRAVQYSVLIKNDPEKAREQAPMMRELGLRTEEVIAEYRDQTGREPAPILTPEQRDFLRSNQDVLDSRTREELRQGIDRAVIHLESAKDKPLDHPMPDQAREQIRGNQQEQIRDRGDSFKGR
jgi:hypothetical protein